MDLLSFQSPPLENKAIHDMLRQTERIEEKAEPRHGAATPELEQTEKGMHKDHVTAEISIDKPVLWSYHINTIWLITRNDLKSIVFPESAFGIASALSGPVLTTNLRPDLLTIFGRIPQVLLWCWINVLIFDTANQRLPTSVIEDAVNKPWRPIPAGRMTPTHGRRILLTILPLAYVATLYLGGMEETVAMMVLTWMYNDLAGADENYIIRNVINAFGFMCYSSGATLVACGFGEHTFLPSAYIWLGIIGAIVFSTLQMQDMADQEGDRARDRRTLPLVHGDGVARWTIAVPVMFWSVLCPAYWELSLYCYALPITTGLVVAIRLLLLRSVPSDKVTWKLWNVWITSVYCLPLLKYHVG